jgi:hypothetical protein
MGFGLLVIEYSIVGIGGGDALTSIIKGKFAVFITVCNLKI